MHWYIDHVPPLVTSPPPHETRGHVSSSSRQVTSHRAVRLISLSILHAVRRGGRVIRPADGVRWWGQSSWGQRLTQQNTGFNGDAGVLFCYQEIMTCLWRKEYWTQRFFIDRWMEGKRQGQWEERWEIVISMHKCKHLLYKATYICINIYFIT